MSEPPTSSAPAPDRSTTPERVERELVRAWDERDKGALDRRLTALARRVADGDEDASQTLLGFLHRTGAVRRVVQRYVPEDEIDDVEQRTLIAVHGSVARFEGRSRFMTWLHSVAVNTALAERRAASRRREMVVDVPPEDRDHSGRISSMVVRRADLGEAIRSLPPEQRAVLRLWDEGHPYEDIAELTGVPVGTVRSRISRARQRLRELTTAERADRETP